MKTTLLTAVGFGFLVACGTSPSGFDNGSDPQQPGSSPVDRPGMMAAPAKLADLAVAFDYACPKAFFGDMHDINNDGRPDFVVGCDGSPTVRISESEGSLALIALPSDPASHTLYGLGFCDANDDKIVDVCAHTFYLSQNLETYSVWQGQADGSFAHEQVIAKHTAGILLRNDMYDVDSDGFADVEQDGAVSRFTMTGLQPVFKTEIHSPRVVDVNGDGLKDIVGDDLQVALATGPGVYGTPTKAQAQDSRNVHIADFDGDGHVDAVVELPPHYGDHDELIGFVRGFGDGTFSGSLDIQHFDVVDIQQIFGNGSKPCVLTGRHERIFCSQNGFDFTSYREIDDKLWATYDARMADLNQDGLMDLVAVGRDDNSVETIHVLLGRK